MKKITFILVLFLFTASFVSASEIIHIKINEKGVNVKTPIIKQNDEVFIPIFELADELGVRANLKKNTLSIISKNSVYEEIASLENVNIKLSARKNEGYLRDFVLSIGDKNVKFPEWVSIDHPHYLPKLYSVDLNDDGQEEIAVFLTLKKGNGMYINDVHLFEKTNHDKNPIHEIFYENLEAEVQKNTAFTYTKDHLVITFNGKKKILIPKSELSSSKTKPNLSVHHFVLYKIKDQTLQGALLVKQGNHQYIGTIIIPYHFQNGVLVADKEKMEFYRH